MHSGHQVEDRRVVWTINRTGKADLRFSLLCLSSLLLSGCPFEPEPVPALPDWGGGVDPRVAAVAGEARAGKIPHGDEGLAALFGGIAAEGAGGDYKIYNTKVQFIVQGPKRSHGYVDTGGNVIDADLVRPEGQLGRDTLDDLFLSFGIGRLAHATAMEVVASGEDGGAVVLRVESEDVLWDFIHGAFEGTDPLLEDQPVSIITDFSLEPDSYSLGITTTIANTGTEAARFNPCDGFIASDEDLLPWQDGAGVGQSPQDPIYALGAAGKHGEPVLSLWSPTGPVNLLAITEVVSSAGLVGVSHGWTDLEPGASLTLDRVLSLAPDTVTAEMERWDSLRQSMGSVSGQVTDASNGEGIEGARVHFARETGDGYEIAGYLVTDADGRYGGSLPASEWTAYAVARGSTDRVDVAENAGRYAPFAHEGINLQQLQALQGESSPPALAWAAGRLSPEGQAITTSPDATATANFALAAPAHLALSISDDEASPLPAVVEVLWASGAPPESAIPAELHDDLGIPQGSVAARAWTTDGELDLVLPPGDYSVRVEHSWRHERVVGSLVTLVAGETASLEASLAEVIPLDGWLSLDGHLHAAPSNDGSLAMEDRLIACAASGVALPVTTDHDRQADYRPLASALGLDSRMQVIPGVEISSVLRGHFNLFPADVQPLTEINGGAHEWWFAPDDTEEHTARMRESGLPESLLQANHPRSGLFDFASYDPESGLPGRESFWSWNFDLFELVNSTSTRNWEGIRPDWFSFLSLGQKKIPTGVSDSHSRTSPCGYGRTDVFLDSTDPSSVTYAQLQDAVLAGHVVVSGGITLRATATQGSELALPGDTIAGSGAELVAAVQGPSWIVPETLRLYRNGEVLEEIVLPTSPDGANWGGHTWTLDDSTDAWYVVEVEGSQALGGMWHGGLPYAAANAFFVDVAGDGWDPPGL